MWDWIWDFGVSGVRITLYNHYAIYLPPQPPTQTILTRTSGSFDLTPPRSLPLFFFPKDLPIDLKEKRGRGERKPEFHSGVCDAEDWTWDLVLKGSILNPLRHLTHSSFGEPLSKSCFLPSGSVQVWALTRAPASLQQHMVRATSTKQATLGFHDRRTQQAQALPVCFQNYTPKLLSTRKPQLLLLLTTTIWPGEVAHFIYQLLKKKKTPKPGLGRWHGEGYIELGSMRFWFPSLGSHVAEQCSGSLSERGGLGPWELA